MSRTFPLCLDGGLTLVPMPGFVELAQKVKTYIEMRGAKKGAKATPVDVVVPEFGERDSGEPFVRLGKPHIGGHDCVVLTSGPGTPKMLMHLLLTLRYLVGRHARRIAVVCGYFPLGRSDKDEGGLEFALPPFVVDLMMAASQNQLDRVVSVDMHAPQVVMAASTGRLVEVSMLKRVLRVAVRDALEKSSRISLVFTDDGAVKRAEATVAAVMDEFGINPPDAFGSKRRKSSSSSNLRGLFGDRLDEILGSIAISIDDEIAGAKTSTDVAWSLKERYGATEVWQVVTHGVLCGKSVERLTAPDCPISRLYTTDTIPLNDRPELARLLASGRVTVVSWVEDLAALVYFHHWGDTLREMR